MATATKSTANTKSVSGKRRGNPQNLKPWKPGQSGNPAGAPKRGESWAEVIKNVSDLTPKDAMKLLGDKGDLVRAFKQMPQNVSLKTLVVLRAFAAMMFEPQASLWSHILDRTEGKVPQPVDMTWRTEAQQAGYDPDELFNQLVEAARARIVVGSGDSGSLADSDG